MAKDKQQELVAEGAAPTPLAPASYSLVGIEPEQKSIHIPLLGREYVVDQLKDRPDILELLHRQGWPHVEKAS